MKLSVVIPAYNEEKTIGRILDHLRDIMGTVPIDDYEVIVIDDHSTDGTFACVESRGDSRIRGYRLSRNSGSHTALRAGLFHASGDAVLCLSADGQDDPDCLGAMLKKWNAGAHIVWALRKNRDNEPLLIKTPAKIFYRILQVLVNADHNNIDLSRADFYLLDRSVVNAINACNERNTSLFGLIAWLGFRQETVDYDRGERFAGSSKWTFKRRVRLALDWIIAFSGIPLRLSAYCGVLFAVAGFLYTVYIILNYHYGVAAPGWSSIIVIGFVTSGVQLIIIGVIGEYLWRNLDETRRRPLYFIENSTIKEKNNPCG